MNLRKIPMIAGLMLLLVLAIVPAITVAHHPEVMGEAVCRDGVWSVTWTVKNSETVDGTNRTMTINSTSRSIGIPGGTKVAPSGSVDGYETLSRDTVGEIKLSVNASWDKNGPQNVTKEGSIFLSEDGCKPPPPPPPGEVEFDHNVNCETGTYWIEVRTQSLYTMQVTGGELKGDLQDKALLITVTVTLVETQDVFVGKFPFPAKSDCIPPCGTCHLEWCPVAAPPWADGTVGGTSVGGSFRIEGGIIKVTGLPIGYTGQVILVNSTTHEEWAFNVINMQLVDPWTRCEQPPPGETDEEDEDPPQINTNKVEGSENIRLSVTCEGVVSFNDAGFSGIGWGSYLKDGVKHFFLMTTTDQTNWSSLIPQDIGITQLTVYIDGFPPVSIAVDFTNCARPSAEGTRIWLGTHLEMDPPVVIDPREGDHVELIQLVPEEGDPVELEAWSNPHCPELVLSRFTAPLGAGGKVVANMNGPEGPYTVSYPIVTGHSGTSASCANFRYNQDENVWTLIWYPGNSYRSLFRYVGYDHPRFDEEGDYRSFVRVIENLRGESHAAEVTIPDYVWERFTNMPQG